MPSDKLLTQIPPDAERARDPFYYYTLLFLAFLQGLFKHRPEGSYQYSDDEELTEIVIADQITNQKESVPRVITARGPAQTIPIALDDVVSKNNRIDERKRVILIGIPMTFNCIAKIGTEAQEIAHFIAHNVLAHRILLQRWGIHKVDKNIAMSPETPTNTIFQPEVVPEGVMVTVVVQIVIRWKTITAPNNSPMVRQIDAYMKSKIGSPTDRFVKPHNDDLAAIDHNSQELHKLMAFPAINTDKQSNVDPTLIPKRD